MQLGGGLIRYCLMFATTKFCCKTERWQPPASKKYDARDMARLVTQLLNFFAPILPATLSLCRMHCIVHPNQPVMKIRLRRMTRQSDASQEGH
jgi:hypothetical protein